MALNAASSSAALGKGTSSTGAQSSRLGPPGLHLPREQLLRARVALRQNELATDELHSPIKTVGHSNLLKDARKMKRHAAIHRDKEKLQRLECLVAAKPVEVPVIIEIPLQRMSCEIGIQTVAVDDSPSVPLDAAEFFRSQVQEIKKIAAEQAEEKFTGVLESQVLLRNSLEETVDLLKQKSINQKKEIDALQSQVEASQRSLAHNPSRVLLPNLDLSAAGSEVVLIQQLQDRVNKLVLLNEEICNAKRSFTFENSGLKAELSRLRHDNVILQDELSELKQQFSDDGNYCDD